MDFSRMEEVRAGWSGDRKYHAWDSGGQEYFLRLSPPEKWEKAQRAEEAEKAKKAEMGAFAEEWHRAWFDWACQQKHRAG